MLDGVLVYIRDILFYCFDYCVVVFARIKHRKKSLLLIRLDAIGDFILWQSSALVYRELYPKHHIVLAANKLWKPLAENQACWDSVWEIDRVRFRRNFAYRWKMLRKFRSARFDTVIQPTYSREFIYGDAIVRISGAYVKVGSAGDLSNLKSWQKKLSNRWYTTLIEADSNAMMELKRNAEFIRGLGMRNFLAEVPSYALTEKKLSFKSPSVPYFVVIPGAGWSGRQWPLRRFAEIIEYISSRTGWLGLICGGPEDVAFGKKLQVLCDVKLEDWSGKTTLQELVCIVANSKMLIGNETGAIHIAAAIGKHAVCVLGGGHHGRFLPYETETVSQVPLPKVVVNHMDCFGCNWKCKFKVKRGEPAPCIEGIETEAVKDCIDTIME